MSESYVNAVDWARRVRPEEPHDLRDLEDVLLGLHPENKERLARTPLGPTGIGSMVWITAVMVASCAPLVGPGVFAQTVWRSPSYTLNVEYAFPQAAIAFVVSCVFLVSLLVDWWRRGRYRSGVSIGFSLLAVGCGWLTLVRADEYVEEFDGNATLYLVPVWVAMSLAVLLVVCHALSPTDPQKNRTGTANLTSESRALLLQEREAALRVLEDRGLLAGDGVDSLSARPLGELHRSKEAAPRE